MVEGKCHCGNVRYTYKNAPPYAVACNCSICRRYAALWAFFTPQEIEVTSQATPITYSWGDKYMNFHACEKCGCVTHNTTTDRCETQRVGVNMRMASLDVLDNIKINKIDGAAF